ncbi:GH39 family glycosyl hydrolase [Silvibacterium dinghuense]|uniref:Glycosyl hydrolase family 39 n=1 Tax=Silvibacterium dinghuense TaxID=1560006 RepID=A0A4Q1SI47_9BACT|nr:glycosyl hydrolase family 39 [Silvibacterium dinghuense]RXS97075.1 glycosyl hydrolase family 39 [Silvibacterium dinghuense]GGG95979.1 beta-xylosidase [Silvibacterium dinghuense]
MLRRTVSCLALSLALASIVAPCALAQEQITVDAAGKTTPLPHFWEQMFGSGRANLTLRAQYREDMRKVASVTDFQYVRFHAIFQDENGVYDEDAQGNPVYNWSYVDQIYDGLLENGVRPYVEISFMPKKLASRLDYHAFWYKQIVAPPADYAKWDALVTAFAKHLIDRYGITEVSQWYFEVWNEPNIDFWTGRPAQQTYFELYDHTAKALKAVSPKIRVGGPATAQAAWVGDMIAHATQNNVPLDFVSTHVYGNDTSKDVFGDDRPVPPHQMVCAAVDKVHDQIEHSARPNMPLIWSEFNATYMNQQEITDSLYMGPWMADTIRQCDGKVQMMSYWTFSDVFEEQGVVKTPFYGGYGLLAEYGIPKPAFNAFKLLHKLGNQRIAEPQDDVLVTRGGDDTVAIAAWNLVEPGASAPDKTFTFDLTRLPWKKVKKYTPTVTISRLDAQHGDTLAAWKAMGSPSHPTQAQIAALKQASDIGKPETHPLENNTVTVTVPQQGLALIEIR